MDILSLYTLSKLDKEESFRSNNNSSNSNVNRLVRKVKVAGTLFIVYLVIAIIFHICMVIATAYLAPSYKPLHAIGYFFFGTFWLAPMLTYYVLANGYTLVAPRGTANTNGGVYIPSRGINNRRL